MRAFVISLAAALALVAIVPGVPAARGQDAVAVEPGPLAVTSEPGLATGGPATPAPAAVTDAASLAGTAAPSNRQVFAECCKICRKGKACGDSCIQRSETCEQPPGCACDGE